MRVAPLPALLVVGLLAACTGGGAPPEPSPSAPPVAGVPSDADGAGAAPAATQATAPSLAAAVAVDGPPRTLAGTDGAAVTIEYPTRAGRTAVLVVTHASPPAIGPLRPAVVADTTLAAAWDADLVTTVAPAGVLAAQRAADLAVVEEGVPAGAVLRDPARRAPDNAYAVARSARRDRPVGERSGDAPPPWSQGPPPATGGRPAAHVVVAAAGSAPVSWTYDTRAGRWLRGPRGAPQRQVDGSPVSAGTVIVLEGRPVQVRRADLRGAGVAAVLRSGYAHAARWRRDDPRRPVRVEQPDGTPFPVEGNVWLHLCAAPCARQIAPSTQRPRGTPR